MTQSSLPTFEIGRHFDTSPETVYQAWTVPSLMRRWLFVSEHNEIRRISADLTVGGRYSILEWDGKQEIDHFGGYEIIDPPTRLAFTLTVPKHFAETTRVSVSIAANDMGGSIMTFSQTGVPRDVTEQNWIRMFNALDVVLKDPNTHRST